MVENQISYPHPVLGNGDDVVIGDISPVVNYEISDEAIYLEVVNLTCGNEDIDKLLAEGSAEWHLRIQCSRTYMRENFSTAESSLDIRLKGEDYEGFVDIEVSVVAKSLIESYSPAGLHNDYLNESFDIGPGKVLGIGQNFRFHVDKVYDPLRAPVSSLLRITEGTHKDGPFTLALDDDLIIISLSKSDWREYAGVRDRLSSVVHSAIVLPALVEAILNVDLYQETLWSGRLKDILEARNINANEQLLAAQEILGNPIARTFSEVNATLDQRDY